MSATPEWSHPYEVRSLDATPRQVTLGADESERAALARRFRIRAIDRLEARLELRRRPDGSIAVTGQVDAAVEQTCVVTLEPFKNQVSEPVEGLFAEGQGPSDEDEFFDPDAEDPPETVENGRIDLGELAAQHLSLGLDPHPRKPGVEFDEGEVTPEAEVHPFAALKGWKGRSE